MFAQIKDYIESQNGQVYIQMNESLLSLPLDSYVILVNAAYGRDDMEKEEIDRLKEYMEKEKGTTWKDVAVKALEWAKKAKDSAVLLKDLLIVLGIVATK